MSAIVQTPLVFGQLRLNFGAVSSIAEPFKQSILECLKILLLSVCTRTRDKQLNIICVLHRLLIKIEIIAIFIVAFFNVIEYFLFEVLVFLDNVV